MKCCLLKHMQDIQRTLRHLLMVYVLTVLVQCQFQMRQVLQKFHLIPLVLLVQQSGKTSKPQILYSVLGLAVDSVYCHLDFIASLTISTPNHVPPSIQNEEVSLA